MPHNRPRRRNRPQTFHDKFWEDEHGKFVVWQKPNKFLITWLVCTVLSWFLPLNWFQLTIGLVGLIALIVWAGLEVWKGVNNFRKLLGVLVLLVLVVSRIV